MNIKVICFSLFLFCFGASLFLHEYYPTWQFYSVVGRAWQLLAGALALLLYTGLSNNKAEFKWLGLVRASSFLGVIGILCGPLTASLSSLVSQIIVVAATFVLLATPCTNTTLEKLILRNQMMRLIGKMSYGLYLFHWPIITLYLYNFGRIT